MTYDKQVIFLQKKYKNSANKKSAYLIFLCKTFCSQISNSCPKKIVFLSYAYPVCEFKLSLKQNRCYYFIDGELRFFNPNIIQQLTISWNDFSTTQQL